MAGEQGNWKDGIVVKQRYTITNLLGKGGMGEVYRAWDGDLRTEVVIKVPLPETMKSAEFVERFEREIRSLVRLSHPHIVRVTDCGNHRGLPFAVMQFLNGGSLKDRYEETEHTLRASPPEELESWLPGVAAALDFIHTQGFVHRDVKPANILFDAHGHPFLSDFGIAKVHADNAAGMTKGLSLTAQNMVLGTPEYMAPEIIMGQAADGRVDQYALAVTAYEVLCGQVPFQGQPTAILVMHTGMQPPPLSQFVGGVPPALEDVVLRGMAKSPDQRFPDCATFARSALDAIRAGVRPNRATVMEARVGATQPVPGFASPGRTAAPAPGPGYPPSGYAPSARPTQSWGHAGAATVAEMSALGAPASHLSLDEIPTSLAPPASADAVGKPANRRKLMWAGMIALGVAALAGTFLFGMSRAGSAGARELSDAEKREAAPLAAVDETGSFTNGLGMTMIAVRPGRFAAAVSDGAPSVGLIASPYWIAAHEATVAQYLEFVRSDEQKGSDQHRPEWLKEYRRTEAYPSEYDEMGTAFRQNGSPVVGITLQDAEAFCRWLTRRESAGKNAFVYRLPTRDEWLCAARAGTSTRFYWGDDAKEGKFNAAGDEDGETSLAVVGKFPPNSFGLFDTAGNAREFVTDPPGVAGSAWDTEQREEATPDRIAPLATGRNVGFRVVATPR